MAAEESLVISFTEVVLEKYRLKAVADMSHGIFFLFCI